MLLSLYLYSSLQRYISKAQIMTLYSPLLPRQSFSSEAIILRTELPPCFKGSLHLTYPSVQDPIIRWRVAEHVLAKLHPSTIFLRVLLTPTATRLFWKADFKMKLGVQEDFGEGAAVKEKGRKQDWEGELFIHAMNFDKSLSAK